MDCSTTGRTMNRMMETGGRIQSGIGIPARREEADQEKYGDWLLKRIER